MQIKMTVSRSPFAAIVNGAGLMAGDIAELAARDIGKEAVRLIQLPNKSGFFYAVNRVRSSAPGESPTSQSGDLVGSMSISGRGREWSVIFDARHAALLEYGTRFMLPRPFLRRAMNNINSRKANRSRWAARAGKNRLGAWWRK